MPEVAHDNSHDLDNMLTARAVARRFGIGMRTLDRWIENHVAFPQPDLVTYDSIGRVASRHWRLRTLIEWESDPARKPKRGRPSKGGADAEAHSAA